MNSVKAEMMKVKNRVHRLTADGQLLATAMIATLSFSCVAVAQPDQGERRRGPPAEAIAACKSLAAGAACSFNGERGMMKGSCWAPEGKPLACKPSDGTSPDKPLPRPAK